MKILGLTGSIGMGKSFVAEIFRELGVTVFDADNAAHEALEAEGKEAIAKAFPGALKQGKIDRTILGKKVLHDKIAVRTLEAIIHPLVQAREKKAIAHARKGKAKVIVLEIPLLYEVKAEKRCDKVIVVTAPYEIQKARVMSRPNMTEEKFAAILDLQIPSVEKEKRADFVVSTEMPREKLIAEVKKIIENMRHA